MNIVRFIPQIPQLAFATKGNAAYLNLYLESAARLKLQVKAHDKVAQNTGRLAVERGPLVYCAEGADNNGKAFDAHLPAAAKLDVAAFAVAGQRCMALKADNGLTLVPYCLWGNRQPGNEMQVWFRTE